jgi:hypothetical protein
MESCEHGKELLDSINGQAFVGYPNNNYLHLYLYFLLSPIVPHKIGSIKGYMQYSEHKAASFQTQLI